LPATTTWLFDPDTFAPASKIVGDKHYSIITDHLGTPLSMFDEKGVLTWGADLDIYGAVKSLQGDRSDCPFRYPGQYEDCEIGLYYNRFRYYDLEGGEYVSQDPIGLLGGFNIYSYVKDLNRWSDPFGLVETEHFPDFDSARKKAFDIASGNDPNVEFTPTKWDEKTGTAVEFKGSNGSKVAYDSPHADMDVLNGHDKPHIGVQSSGKRKVGGTTRYNLTYDGPQHPHRPNKKYTCG
jgi:RHS repeat-associated protein